MHYANIDKPRVPNHSELLDRITYVKVGVPQTNPHFHGQSCASIHARKTTGIATSSKLYYFSVPDTPNRPAHYFEAINKIIEINKFLPQNGRIRVVSISDGLEKKDSIWNEWQNTLNKANESGLSVVNDIKSEDCYVIKDNGKCVAYVAINEEQSSLTA